MRKSVSKRLRIAFFAIALIIIGIFSYLLLITINNTDIREEKIDLYNYSNKTNVEYEVFLRPNALYNSESLGEDKIYLTSFVNNIKTNFLYEFNIDEAVNIKGSYEVVAIVEGYTSVEEEKVKTIWKKEFSLLPKTNFQSKDAKAIIGKEVIFSLDEYNLFSSQISEAAKINIPVKLTVLMNINLQADAGSQVIEKSFSPAITMLLNTNYFEITKSGVEEKFEKIEEIKEIQLPINMNLVIIYSLALGIGVIALLYILIFVKGDAAVDIVKKRLNKIFKVYGNRLVAINSEIGTSFSIYYKVKSIEDLVRIADELSRPIIYKYSNDFKDITKFYIYDDKFIYIYNLLDIMTDIDTDAGLTESKHLNSSKEIPIE